MNKNRKTIQYVCFFCDREQKSCPILLTTCSTCKQTTPGRTAGPGAKFGRGLDQRTSLLLGNEATTTLSFNVCVCVCVHVCACLWGECVQVSDHKYFFWLMPFLVFVSHKPATLLLQGDSNSSASATTSPTTSSRICSSYLELSYF